MGEFATAIQERLGERLAGERPDYEWTVEEHIAGTPVDVVGRSDAVVALVELEWRRADPADNAAKLFRHLAEGDLEADRAIIFQLFTAYYDLANGGVSSKRRNATFVGAVAADQLDGVTYNPLDLEIDPPKSGAGAPAEWEAAVDEAAEAIAGELP